MLLRYTYLTFLCLLGVATANAQNTRSIDGTNNNLTNPEWGAVEAQLIRVAPENYSNGVNSLGGPDWPNPRVISNTLFAQDGLLNDPLSLSDYCWVWGQFIDHDITLVKDGIENIEIQVPTGDPWFDPFGTGDVVIPMRRSAEAPGTGTGANNPRQHFNSITAFVDASGVYGSEQERADWLRTFQGGKLKTSTGNLLPYNTLDGEKSGEIDDNAPEMDHIPTTGDKYFVAGDVRANENPLLLSFHTLFVREHNRLCDELAAANPSWTDEELYQYARRIVGGIIQAVVYEEWLPTMGVHLPDYTGYDDTVNPGISNVFSAAAYRMGHTLLNSNIMRMANDGSEIPEGNLSLQQAFFAPSALENGIGIDPYFKGMGVQIQQNMDSKVIDDVRNFLFGPPGAGGLDLASINITRGRERGIPGLNEVREAFGLTPYSNFYEITSDFSLASTLEAMYGDIEDIDAWVGMLSEDHMPDALFGTTVMEIMMQQFAALRDGDRFYYEIDPVLSAQEIQTIKDTRLVDVLMRNTGIDLMQQNVFEAMPHDMICTTDEPFAQISGLIQTEADVQVANVTVEILTSTQGIVLGVDDTDANGAYDLGDRETCESYVIRPLRNDEADNGVTTLDMVVLRNHILNIQSLDSPYKLIAADANNSGTISTLDMVEIRKVILIISDNFANNSSWRFVDADYEFPDPDNPWLEEFPETVAVANLEEAVLADFVAIKIGDLNNSVDPAANGQSVETRSAEPLVLAVDDREAPIGESVTVSLDATDLVALQAVQFTFNFDPGVLQLESVHTSLLPEFSEENYHLMERAGVVTVAWNGPETELFSEDALMEFNFRVIGQGHLLSEMLSLNDRYTPAIAYNETGQGMDIGLQFNGSNGALNGDGQLALYQNVPNPFGEATEISFYLPESGAARLSIFDAAGRMLYLTEQEFGAGLQRVQIRKEQLQGAAGILYYRLDTEYGQATRRMVISE